MTGEAQEAQTPRNLWRTSVFSANGWRRHLTWFVASIAAGAAALYFHYAEKCSEQFTRILQEGGSPLLAQGSPYYPAAVVFISMIVICRLRDRYFRGTEGTGIPQAMAALNIPEGPERSAVLSVRIAIGKIFLLTLALFAGATIGREGPSVHVGACFMYLSSKITRFPEHLVRRGLILAGGAAGIAAAFNAPIAGAVFAFEEIGRSFEKNNAGTIVRTVAVACIFCVVFLGNYLFYGSVHVELHSVQHWLVVPAIGVVGGLLGGLFAQAVASTTPVIGRLSRRRPYVVAASLGLALAILGLLSHGQTYGSGFSQAQAILIHGEQQPVYYAFAKAAGSFVCLISAIPGGLFDPSFSVGAALGQLALPVMPAAMDPQAVILLAMVSYFAGVVQSPITSVVILLEMTSARFMTLPMVVAAMLAYEASHLVCRTSLYESLADNFLKTQADRQ